ncbi:MAG: acyl-CoA thioesterase-1 [Kiritimatiellia bacterium]|jgi:acyl-CoA thioesterase-1
MKKSTIQIIHIAILILGLFSSSIMAKNILVLGDSISAAYGFGAEKGWVNLLEIRLKQKNHTDYTLINASVSGNTTRDGLGRLPALLKEYQPKIIIIELGGNDGLRGYPIKIMETNLQKIIDLSNNNEIKILLAGIEIPPNYGQRYTDLFRQSFIKIASKNDIAFLPFILKGVATDANLMQNDGIHPTADAQPILLDNIWTLLKPLL